jgi:hypothetical protein
MKYVIKKFFSVFFVILFFSFSGSTIASTADSDTTSDVICNIIRYVWSIGGPLMTVVIIGAAMMAIFGRMPWPALFALGVFCAVFFGAGVIVEKLIKGVGTGNESFMEKCGAKGVGANVVSDSSAGSN